MADYKLTELLMHYLEAALGDASDSMIGELDELRQSLMRLESAVERFNEVLKTSPDAARTALLPPRYEYKTLYSTAKIDQYAAIGYRVHSVTPDGSGDDGSLVIIMEREIPAEELEDDIFTPSNGSAGI